MVKNYLPQSGDLVWVNFNPTVGHERANLRPALVITPKFYNSKSGMALMCPITSQVRGYPFEVVLDNKKIEGVVRVDQLRSIDWRARKVKYITKVSEEKMLVVKEVLASLIFS